MAVIHSIHRFEGYKYWAVPLHEENLKPFVVWGRNKRNDKPANFWVISCYCWYACHPCLCLSGAHVLGQLTWPVLSLDVYLSHHFVWISLKWQGKIVRLLKKPILTSLLLAEDNGTLMANVCRKCLLWLILILHRRYVFVVWGTFWTPTALV